MKGLIFLGMVVIFALICLGVASVIKNIRFGNKQKLTPPKEDECCDGKIVETSKEGENDGTD